MINFLFFAILSYLGGAVLSRQLLFKLAYFFFFLHIALKYYQINLARNFKLQHELLTNHLFCNEELQVKITAKNESWLPILWFKVEELLPIKLTRLRKQYLSYFKPKSKLEWKFKLKARQRGLYKIGPLKWESSDLLAYNLLKGELAELELYVYPEILELTEFGLPSRLPFGKAKWPQPIYKDPYQVKGVRDYQPSDQLNKIHWKATARTGQLKTRENESTVAPELALVLNFSAADYGLKFLEKKTELAVTAVASLAYHFEQLGYRYKFITNAELAGETEPEIEEYKSDSKNYQALQLPAGSGNAQLQQLLEILAWVKTTQANNFNELLLEKVELSWGGTLIIFSDKDDLELMQVCEQLKQRGYQIIIFLLGNEIKNPQYQNLPLTAPLVIQYLTRESDLYAAR